MPLHTLLGSAVAVVWRLLGNPGRVAEIWRRMALPLAVIIAVGHMSKGPAKFVSWAPFLPQVLCDPHGVDTTGAYARRQFSAGLNCRRSHPSFVAMNPMSILSMTY